MKNVKSLRHFAVPVLGIFISLTLPANADKKEEHPWHDQKRKLRYEPDGNGFVITNGTKRFNRALYGTNTGFRVEAGDLPEFALYMPGMGGTLRLGLIRSDSSKWLMDASVITARYEAGSMTYVIEDPLLDEGRLHLKILAMADADGFILKVQGDRIPGNLDLFWVFGGASGNRFPRNGDLGADPESVFYIKPENCTTNEYFISGNTFDLVYGQGKTRSGSVTDVNNSRLSPETSKIARLPNKNCLYGIVPLSAEIKLSDATEQENPLRLFYSENAESPAITGRLKLKDELRYFLILDPDTKERPGYGDIPRLFDQADSARKSIAGQVKIKTPDGYINAACAGLSTAADAIWDGQSFMHGAIAWRVPLPGWRGAYAADWLGWHDRAKTHFRGYFKAQYTEPASGPSVPDEKTHLTRQKEKKGTALFTEGYISRTPGKPGKPHHYDMNQVFISQLLWHFRWTGDLDFLRESWPVLERHLAWEKRCFDGNHDGLYDAYASIWASDALQYSGGGVTYASAYNYRANRLAAELAPLIGKDPSPYRAEAEKIKEAVNKQLWMPEKGWFAESKDLLSHQLVHPTPAVWTIYHAIDEGLADPFQAYQSTLYIDQCIPHIPVEAEGLETGKYYTISTTNWMPYTWSINNVALAEVLHTALAYWQCGRNQKAFELTKSSLLDYMFLGSSPGNFGQLSFYDAFRGELYRDFADPVAMAARALVEGLFGISPDMINRKLTIKPGWPADWEYASIETPDIRFSFQQKDHADRYLITSHFLEDITLNLVLYARSDEIRSVTVNGKEAGYKVNENAIGNQEVIIETAIDSTTEVKIQWSGSETEVPAIKDFYAPGEALHIKLKNATILELYDPQQTMDITSQHQKSLTADLKGEPGWKTAFIKLKQHDLVWWQPVSFDLRQPVQIIYEEKQSENKLAFSIRNNLPETLRGSWSVGAAKENIEVPARSISGLITVSEGLIPGSNKVEFHANQNTMAKNIINWNIAGDTGAVYEKLDISAMYNDRVTNIFKEQYYIPRSPYPTLSIPVQGIGDWCSYSETEEIDDSGMRAKAGSGNEITSPQGIPFYTPGEGDKNILFTSTWDNYPDSVMLPVSGKASHLYLLMAGSAHHMQINMINGWLEVQYTDGSVEVMPLKSPENWWPIEQDYYEDGFAFKVDAPQPPRLHLKTGEWRLVPYNILSNNRTIRIDGGAASLLDMPLNPDKELATLKLETNTNDVVIGLMAATLKRN